MAHIPALINDLAYILLVAGVVTLLFKRLRQPFVLGYLVAGFLVSPHMPLTHSVADAANVQTWADIGVLFLLFSLGLDFSFKKIVKMGMAPVIAASTIIFSMMTLGVCAGHAFGWSRINSLFLGGMLAMSSTTIIYKAFDDLGLRQQRFAQMVMSVLILEDVLAIVMMVMLSAIAGGGADGGALLGSVLKIAFFLVLWFVVGIFLVPWFLRATRRLMTGETLVVVSIGLCCTMAVLSTRVGFSSAFGAFVMGSILAETIEAEKIARLVAPVRDLFGAVFFVSVGMLVDPAVLSGHALTICALVVVIVAGQAVLGTSGFLLSGQPLPSALKSGFSMAQIGEFAFIIASLGLSLGVLDAYVYPVVVAVSVITTFLTPYLIKAADPACRALERRLPRRWIRRLNHITAPAPSAAATGPWRKLLRGIAINVAVYATLSVAVVALMFMFFLPFVRRLLPGWELHWWANAICGALTILLIAPFLRAMVMKKMHSDEFKTLWTESRPARLPLVFTVVVRVALAASFIFYIINYLSRFADAMIAALAVAAVALMVLSRGLKKRSITLERLFVQNLRSRDIAAEVSGARRPLFEGRLLDRDIHIATFDVPEDSLWSGHTLRELALRQRYGTHLSSILRGRHRINIPSGDDMLFPGDTLQVIGSDEQLHAFGAALARDTTPDDPDIEDREMKLRQMVLRAGSPFIGRTLKESGIRDRMGCMVVGVEEGQESLTMINPQRKFEQGDIVWVVGEQKALDALAGAKDEAGD